MAKSDSGPISADEGGNGGGSGGAKNTVDPATITAAARDSGDATPGNTGGPNKRHRRTKAELEAAGYKPAASRPTQTNTPLTVNSVQFSLTGIHALLAVGFSAPELALDETEAKTLSENIVAVSRHYDLQQTQKATDWGNLVVSMGIIYGGRLVRISARNKAALNERRARAAGLGAVEVATSAPQPSTASPTVTVRHPNAAGKPTGAMPLTRPKIDADQVLLNEIEPYIG